MYEKKLQDMQESTVRRQEEEKKGQNFELMSHLKQAYTSLQQNHRLLNTQAKMKNEEFTKELRHAFSQQSQSIKRMHDALKDANFSQGGGDEVWPNQQFINIIKQHEQRVHQLIDMERLAMVKGGSIS